MTMLQFNKQDLDNSTFNTKTNINELSPKLASTVLYVDDLFTSVAYFHHIFKFNVTSLDIDHEKDDFTVVLQHSKLSSTQFSKSQDPMSFTPHSLILKKKPSLKIKAETIGHICMSVHDVKSFYKHLVEFETLSDSEITHINDLLHSLNNGYSRCSNSFQIEYLTKLGEPGSKAGIFFLNGPGDVPIEVYQYAHRPNSLQKDKEIEVVEDLGIRFNHTMIEFFNKNGDMKDVLAFYVNVLGMRVLDVKHNKVDKFSLYFVGYLPKENEEWEEDKGKGYLPRRAREGYLQLRYHWDSEKKVDKKEWKLAYFFEIVVNDVIAYLGNVTAKYTDVDVDFKNKTIKDPAGHVYKVIQKINN